MRTSPFVAKILRLLGPAFVAAVAYVDPGNFAANFGAGAEFGYTLLWVLILANLMAVLAQYLSAKIGIVTGKSLPELIAERLPKWGRLLYWIQAEVVAVATDLAEVVGGAIALQLLWGIPLVWGGVIIGIISMGLLYIYSHHGQRWFERVILVMLLLIPLGFLYSLVNHPPRIEGIVTGLVPRLDSQQAVLLASAMIGATIMPHVVYLHSALARDRHGKVAVHEVGAYLNATKIDVAIAMVIAGTVNISMLLLAASTLHGQKIETFVEIFRALGTSLGGLVAVLFAAGLLISGLASTAVGNQAGSVILRDFTEWHIPTWVRRVMTMLPALILLAFNVNPMTLLILSQVALSIGVPFALIPLLVLTSRRRVMGEWANSLTMKLVVGISTLCIVVLNLVLIIQTLLQ